MVESICVSKGFDGQVEVAMDEPGCFGQPGSGLIELDMPPPPLLITTILNLSFIRLDERADMSYCMLMSPVISKVGLV